MPKVVSEDEKRVKLNCLIAPATRKVIEEMRVESGESQGEVVDRAVALLAFGEEIQSVPMPKLSAVVDSDPVLPGLQEASNP